MFSDRNKGAAMFSSLFDGAHVHCSEHLHRNSRESDQVDKVDKGYPKAMFWALQGSGTDDEFKRNLKALHAVAPTAAGYLAKVDRALWVEGDILKNGNSTGGWRTSNMTEISNAVMNSDRFMHPARVIERFVQRCSARVCKERQLQKQDLKNKEVLVEHARAIIAESYEQSKCCVATQTAANTYTSQFEGPGDSEGCNRSTRNSGANPLTDSHPLRKINFDVEGFDMCT